MLRLGGFDGLSRKNCVFASAQPSLLKCVRRDHPLRFTVESRIILLRSYLSQVTVPSKKCPR